MRDVESGPGGGPLYLGLGFGAQSGAGGGAGHSQAQATVREPAGVLVGVAQPRRAQGDGAACLLQGGSPRARGLSGRGLVQVLAERKVDVWWHKQSSTV